MTKKLLSVLSVLALCMSVSAFSHAQEGRPGADLSDIDPGLAKQIARDKQLLEIWKDHVRKLTQERDEAYQKIEALKSSPAPKAPVEDTALLDDARQEKESALQEAAALRSQVAVLKTQISKLEVQGANRQFAVEVAPENPVQNPASQKFYADLTKNYMLQQGSIRKLKEDLARLESEKSAASQEQLLNARSENEGLQKSYNEAMDRIQVLESETQKLSASSKGLEAMLAQVNAEKARLSDEIEKSRGLEGQVAKLNSENQARRNEYDTVLRHADDLKSRAQNSENELQKTNANNHALQELIEKLKTEARELRDQKTAADRTIQELNVRFDDQTAKSKETESGLKSSLMQAEESARQAGEAREDLAAQNQALKEKLDSNAADIQNLKENFDTMLEPLLSSFDDRKKVV